MRDISVHLHVAKIVTESIYGSAVFIYLQQI